MGHIFRPAILPKVHTQMLPQVYHNVNMQSENILRPPPSIRVQDMWTYFGLREKYVRGLIARREILASRPPGGRIWSISTASVYKFLKKYQNLKEEKNGI